MTTDPIETVKTYLRHLHASDTEGLIACFEDDGLVHSPFLGTMVARDFFRRLSQASNGSVITVHPRHAHRVRHAPAARAGGR